MNDWIVDKRNDAAAHRLEPHQVRAAAAPQIPLKELADDEARGNFRDLEGLLDQLKHPPIMELGKPDLHVKFLPKRRVGSCPSAHNRALLGDKAG